MKRKVIKIASDLTETISGWNGIDAVILGEAAETDVFDPYFNIDLDVFYKRDIPAVNDRQKAFNDPGAFETSPLYVRDKFLLEDLPVCIHYIPMSRVDFIIDRIEKGEWIYRETGTNMFYRMEKNRMMLKNSQWIDRVKSRLSKLPSDFWQTILDYTKNFLEGYLNDIGAAVFREDDLYYLLSSSGFVKSLCSFVFALNKQFEPSGRKLYERVVGLKVLPEGFAARVENLVNPKNNLSPEKKREIAELLTRSLIKMG